MQVRTALSVTCAGHLIDLRVDADALRAEVRVTPLRRSAPSANDLASLEVAADLLARKAARSLGDGWRIVQWRSGRIKATVQQDHEQRHAIPPLGAGAGGFITNGDPDDPDPNFFFDPRRGDQRRSNPRSEADRA
jgi:hypothetical protein